MLLAVMVISVAWLALSPNPPRQADTGWDKLNHVLAFTVLAVCARGAAADSPRLAHRLWWLLVAFGGLIEIAQTQVPGRSGEWTDLLADAVGVACVALVCRISPHAGWPRPSDR